MSYKKDELWRLPEEVRRKIQSQRNVETARLLAQHGQGERARDLLAANWAQENGGPEGASREAEHAAARAVAAALKPVEAYRFLTQALERLGPDAQTGRERAERIAAAGHPVAALEEYTALAALYPQAAVVHLGRARLAARLGDLDTARASALDAFAADPSPSTERAAAALLANLRSTKPTQGPGPVGPKWASPEARIAILGNATLDPLAPALALRAQAAGLSPEIYVGPFDGHWREVLDTDSGLARFQPQVTFFFVDPAAILGEALRDFGRARSAEPSDAEAVVQPYLREMRSLLAAARERFGGRIVVANAISPSQASLAGGGPYELVTAINAGLARIAAGLEGVHVLNLDRAASAFGLDAATDARMWFMGRVPFSAGFQSRVADEMNRFVRAALGRQAKCLVVDLDNTLWGGVVGEDGPHGIAVGNDYPGNAFKAFQQEVKRLAQRGVILAVASKNNREDALEALDGHPDMVLRSKDFACLKIDWRDKGTTVAEIIADLNIGADQVVFLDDNPAERACVRAALPQVRVPDLPTDPALYASFLADLAAKFFDVLDLSNEDAHRADLYAQEARRKDFQRVMADITDYYRGLDQKLSIAEVGSATLPRVVQLLARTNQFNATTRRYSGADLEAMLATGRWRAWTLNVADRFGDAGLTGCALAEETKSGAWRIDSFLLSCRVLGRTVETAFLALVLQAMREAGGREVYAEYLPTAKNKPISDFYDKHGFERARETDEGVLYRTQLDRNPTAVPEWITVEEEKKKGSRKHENTKTKE